MQRAGCSGQRGSGYIWTADLIIVVVRAYILAVQRQVGDVCVCEVAAWAWAGPDQYVRLHYFIDL